MNFEEHAAKPLLARYGIAVPKGALAATPEEAAQRAKAIGAVVVNKATGSNISVVWISLPLMLAAIGFAVYRWMKITKE